MKRIGYFALGAIAAALCLGIYTASVVLPAAAQTAQATHAGLDP
jgi:hypothetical protein